MHNINSFIIADSYMVFALTDLHNVEFVVLEILHGQKTIL